MAKPQPSPGQLRRQLGLWEGMALTTAAVFGTGVLVLPGTLATMAGPASLVSWAIMAVWGAPMALTFGHLAARVPQAGGVADYVRAAFGPRVGRAVAVMYLGSVPLGAPLAALMGSAYLAAWGISPQGQFVGALALCLAAVGLNALGVRMTGAVGLAVVGAVAFLLLAGAGLGLAHAGARALGPFAPHGLYPVGYGVALLYWAFVGWEQLGHLAEEFGQPEREIPQSVGASLALVSTVYLAVAIAVVATGVYRHHGATALAQLYALSLGPWGARAAAVVALLATYGTIHAYVAGFSRLLYSLARGGELPAWLGRVSPTGVPLPALLALGASSTAILVLAWWAGKGFLGLLGMASGVFVVMYLAAMASALRLLPRARWPMAVAGALLCLVAFPFLGWEALYPMGLAALGVWVAWHRSA